MCNVVNGRIANFHSDKDTVIKYLFTQIHPGQRPIGIEKMLVGCPLDEDGVSGHKKANNVDVTKEAGSHAGYRDGSAVFLQMVHFLY